MESHMSLRPEFVTNKKGETVAKALAGYWQGLLDAMKEPPTIAISTAYFNPGGFTLLANQLEQAGHVRLMIGAEPDVTEDLSRLRHLSGNHLPEDDGHIRLSKALTSSPSPTKPTSGYCALSTGSAPSASR